MKKSRFYTDGMHNGLDNGGGRTSTKKVENGKSKSHFMALPSFFLIICCNLLLIKMSIVCNHLED